MMAEVIHVTPQVPTVETDLLVHLHGHNFQVLYRSEANAGHFDPNNMPTFPQNPVRRDVILVKGGGYAIIAWPADSPGVWYIYASSSS